mgnify:CR=1 FL=1|jgi:drug/metabolite transporter (DMT)-like permease
MGVALVILAAFFWGVSGGIAAELMDRGWDPLVVSFYRGAVGLVCFAVWWLSRLRTLSHPDRKAMLWAALAGLGVAGNFTFYFLAISFGSVAVAVTLMYTAPVYVYLVMLATGSERLTPGITVVILAVLLGVALLTGLVGGVSELSLAAVAAGIAAGMAYAVFLFGFRNAAARASPAVALGVAFLVFVLALGPFVDHYQLVAAPLSVDAPLFLLLGLLGAGLSFFLYVVGLKTASAVSVSLVGAVEPVTAALFGLLVLDQTLGTTQWLGMVVILAAVTFMSVRRHAK